MLAEYKKELIEVIEVVSNYEDFKKLYTKTGLRRHIQLLLLPQEYFPGHLKVLICC